MSVDYADFVSALRMRESSGNYEVVNPYGYLGAYQFGEGALIDLGFVNHDGNWQNNDFSGGWTGLHGVQSTEEFLNSRQAQDLAADAWFPLMWSYLVGVGADDWLGQTVAGITISASGLIAGAHLLGQRVVLDWLKSDGAKDPVDQFGTPVSEYIVMFNSYFMPFDTGEPGFAALGERIATYSDSLGSRVEEVFDTASQLLFGEDGTDAQLTGSSKAEVLLGQDGDDRLVGRRGGDALLGGDGDDTIIAGPGADVSVGGDGHDAIEGRSGKDLLLGNAGDDVLSGGRGNDILKGASGNDTLNGGIGKDRLIGNTGNDSFRGGGGADLFVFRDGDGEDTIRDFDTEEGDRIDLSDVSVIAGFNDLVENHIQSEGDNLVIVMDAVNRLALKDTDLRDLSAEDFLF